MTGMPESEHRLSADEHLVAAWALQRRLSEAVSGGVGLAGLASVLAELVGRPATIWAACRITPVVSTPDVCPPTRPEPHTTPSWSNERPFLHEGWLWRMAQPGDSESLVVVGVEDADDTAGEEQRLALEETAAIAALEVYRIQSVAAAEVRAWGELADEIIDDRNRARVRAHAEALGFDHSTRRRVALVISDAIDTSALDKISSAAHLVDADALVTARDHRVVLIVADAFDCEMFLPGLHDAMVAEPFAMGISACHDVVGDYQKAGHEAEVAAAVGAALQHQGVTRYEDLGVYRLLAANGDTTELDDFVQRYLGPLIEYDATHQSELVRSLSEYLERGGALDQASESLFIHRSTLKYRLGRIAGLTGLDLTDPDTRFNLQIATRALTTIRALAATSSEWEPGGTV